MRGNGVDQSKFTCSVVNDALRKYLDSIPPAKRKKEFFHSCCDPNRLISLDVVQNKLQELERQSNTTGSSKLSKFFRRVVETMKEFHSVVTILTSADPMPSALIWGGISLIIEYATRHFKLMSDIQSHLQQMGDILSRLVQYRPQYQSLNNPTLWALLCESFICVFKLLSRIHKEISKTGLQATLSSFSSSGINKLSEIIQKLKEKEDSLSRLVQILNGGFQQDWHREEIEKEINTWLHLQAKGVPAANHSRLDELEGKQDPRTFLWTTENARISSWLNPLSDTKLRVLPLYAPPGSGKSTLCARTIKSLLDVEPRFPVLYHFYHFDQSFKAVEVLCHFASQLFRFLISSELHPCPPDMIRRFNKIISDENTLPRFRAEKIIEEIVIRLPSPIWVFLDGLDEEGDPQRWKDVIPVLHFLFALSTTALNVRLWNSSQNIRLVQDVYKDHVPMDIGSELKMDMVQFLSKKALELDIPAESQELVKTQIDENGSGGFLWAHMLIADLEGAASPAEKKAILVQGPSLGNYYDRFFRRMARSEKKVQEALDIFALVAYARRPLKIGELQEAVAILRNKKLQNIQQEDLPYTSFIKRVCSPLIIFKGEIDDSDERMEVCHLYHSAVFRFLREHDSLVFKDSQNPGYQIGHQEVIAEACLKYLLQSRYARNLEKRDVDGKDEWTDFEGKPISGHWFLSYAAKYWDKHRDLDELVDLSTFGLQLSPNQMDAGMLSIIASKAERESATVMDFLKSDNFTTLLQIQSLLVVGQFFLWVSTSKSERKYFLCLKRVLPNWLEIDDTHYWMGYGQFCSEWISVLCRLIGNRDEFLRSCLGEIDRCWWGALAPTNFLNRHEARSRYPSFRLQRTGQEGRPSGYICSTVSGTGTVVCELHVSVNGASAHMFLDRWTLHQEKFNLGPSEERLVSKLLLNLEQYMLCAKCLSPRHDRANFVDFDESGNCFRIGTQLYLRRAGTHDNFQPLAIPGLKYVEEIASRGSIVVVARRRKSFKSRDLQTFGRDIDHICCQNTSLDDNTNVADRYHSLFGFEAPEQLDDSAPVQIPSSPQSFDNSDTSSDSSMYDTSDSDSSCNAYESWSDCSSDRAGNGFEQGEVDDGRRLYRSIAPLNSSSEGETEENNSDMSSSSEDAGSSSDESETSRRELGGVQIRRPYGEEVLSSDEEEAYYGRYVGRKRREALKKGTPSFQASMRVYNAASTQMPQEIFSFSTGLELPLNGSPPVIHPTHSLIVWPLSGGKLLFADFEGDSYFIRKLKASTSLTKHIFLRCQFSKCGRFLHVAALESMEDMPDRKESTHKVPWLSMVTYTYSLCSSQPTRTPPKFIHQARADLGQYDEISDDNLPFTLTWSEKMLYVTEQSLTLKVLQISLFPTNSTDPKASAVFRPEKTIALPGTSLRRNVHFFPHSKDGSARLILSAHFVYPRNFPAIGCFLDEEKDLGRWVPSVQQDVPSVQGDLIRPMERFNPEEDCDLRPFLFQE